jgi:hypothetical protein
MLRSEGTSPVLVRVRRRHPLGNQGARGEETAAFGYLRERVF